MYENKEHFRVPMKLLIPTFRKISGVTKKEYPDTQGVSDDYLFFGSFKTYGGTEETVNGVVTIKDTAIVNTWFRDDITSDCRVYVLQTGRIYDVISPPENIDMRNIFMQFKLAAIGGKP